MKCTVKFISVTWFSIRKNQKKILAKKFLRYLLSVFPKMRFSIVNTTHCISVKNSEKQTYTSQLFTKHKLPIYQNDCLDKRINLRYDSFQNLTFIKKVCKITYLVWQEIAQKFFHKYFFLIFFATFKTPASMIFQKKV